MAVVGVDDHGDARQASRHTSDESSLGRVGMNNVRSVVAHDAVEGVDRPQVRQGSDLATQGGDPLDGYTALLRFVDKIALPGALFPDEESGLIAPAVQTGREQNDVEAGSADVQPGEEPDYPDGRLRGAFVNHARF